MGDSSSKDYTKRERSDEQKNDENKGNSAGVQMVSSLTGEISHDGVGGTTTTVSDLVYRSAGEPGDSIPSSDQHVQTERTFSMPQPPADGQNNSDVPASPGAYRIRGIDWHESMDLDDENGNDNDDNNSSSMTAMGEIQPRDGIEPIASARPVEDSFVAIATELTDEDSILDDGTGGKKFGSVSFRGNRARLCAAVSVGLILCLAILAGVLAGTKSGDNNTETSPPPTSTQTTVPTISPTPTNSSQSPELSTLPTFTPAIRAEMITNSAVSISGEKALQDGTAQHKALSWILNEDPQQLSPSDPRLLQRYIASLLYFQLDGENWLDNSGYLSSANECEWSGITCGKWRLNKWAIQDITIEKNLLKGEIPVEVSELPDLRILDLRNNLIHGTVPTEFGKMEKLIHFSLNGNLLTGAIPPTIGNMTNVRMLGLCCNLLNGTIPFTVGTMEKVITIAFDQNSLTGTITPEFSNLANLQYLSVRDNKLTGSIPPRLGKLVSLTDLHLYTNKLNGTIPSELGNLTKITNLYLQGNELVGMAPQSLCDLRQGPLRKFEVDCDEISCSCCTNCDNI